MSNFERIFLIVLDSFGVGEMPDAHLYGDEGSNTLGAIRKSPHFCADNMEKLGLLSIDGVEKGTSIPKSCRYAKMAEASGDKDTITGHWEMMGIISPEKCPKYPNGFPKDILDKLEKATGRKMLCNKPYSGTKVIADYGEEHLKTGDLILYTSADSVCQIAAHEDIVPCETLYAYCRAARKIFTGKDAVSRVIARPFIGTPGHFERTERRHDFSVEPPRSTVLNNLADNDIHTVGVGKINDIFIGKQGKTDYKGGIKEGILSTNNEMGMEITMDKLHDKNFKGFCFTNLVEFDMLYGHRNDVDGYAKAIARFDAWLGGFLKDMTPRDLLMITGDHGCDPSTPSTDHSREYVPILLHSPAFLDAKNLGVRKTFADIGKTIEKNFGIESDLPGESLL